MKEKNWIGIFFGVSSSRSGKKRYVKNEKKNGAENGLGYCPTVSQYNGKLYCDTAGFGSAKWLASVSQYNHCIMTW